MPEIILIAHNLRSAHNVGSLLRTAEGLGLNHVYLTGYTPYPNQADDYRLPHIANKVHKQISKTALGAEAALGQHIGDIDTAIYELKNRGFVIAALEQSDNSKILSDYLLPDKVALIVGREVEGIEPEVLAICDVILEIPMKGKKESFNVAQAAAMALYQFTLNTGRS